MGPRHRRSLPPRFPGDGALPIRSRRNIEVDIKLFSVHPPAMKKALYVELKKFLGTVLHPDWTIEHESADHAIRKFARKAEDKTRKAILADIHHLLTERNNDD